jgi:hypothetical protein
MNKPIRKAVLPVAGLGTRLLPATKTIPKEMLPIVDRPIVQHVIDEAREAGVEEFIFRPARNRLFRHRFVAGDGMTPWSLPIRSATDRMEALRKGMAPEALFSRMKRLNLWTASGPLAAMRSSGRSSIEAGCGPAAHATRRLRRRSPELTASGEADNKAAVDGGRA